MKNIMKEKSKKKKEKDLVREQEIIKLLGCKFIRISNYYNL